MGKTFKGRPLKPGDLEGTATVSKQAFNTSGSYIENMFAGNTETAPCTDSSNADLAGKDLAGMILCTTQTVGSTLGGSTFMGVNALGLGPKAILFAWHVDSVSYAGIVMDDVWYDRRIITIDQLGDEFLEAVKTGDKIKISSDGTVEVG